MKMNLQLFVLNQCFSRK